MNINRIPGAVWPVLYGAVYLGLQTFVAAQWPDTPPAYLLGLMAALGVLQGAIKILWPEPTVPLQDIPPGAAAAPRGAAVTPVTVATPGKVNRFLI